MLKRMYVNNFRCMVNFEIDFDTITLLMGANGAGKSTLLDILARLRSFILLEGDVSELFPFREWTLWVRPDNYVQSFELELEGNGGRYLYRLSIEHDPEKRLSRMKEEYLTYNGSPLFHYHSNNAHLYRDNHSPGPEFPMDWSRSGVGWLMEGPDNRKMGWFRDHMRRLFLVRLNPEMVDAISQEETSVLAPNLANFASWYHHLMLTQPDCIQNSTLALQEILPGFRNLHLPRVGEDRRLTATFTVEGKTPYNIPFSALSDGQKSLIVLYTILKTVNKEDNATLFIDEPENYLSLPEVQPWLNEIIDAGEAGGQFILISHHPRVINFLAERRGHWLYRNDRTGPTRVERIRIDEADSGLSVATLVDLGWIMDEMEKGEERV